MRFDRYYSNLGLQMHQWKNLRKLVKMWRLVRILPEICISFTYMYEIEIRS